MHHLVGLVQAIFMGNVPENVLIVFQMFDGNVIFGESVDQINLSFYLDQATVEHQVVLGSLQLLIVCLIDLIFFVVGLYIGLDEIDALQVEE